MVVNMAISLGYSLQFLGLVEAAANRLYLVAVNLARAWVGGARAWPAGGGDHLVGDGDFDGGAGGAHV
jgi:hypothetical protein